MGDKGTYSGPSRRRECLRQGNVILGMWAGAERRSPSGRPCVLTEVRTMLAGVHHLPRLRPTSPGGGVSQGR